MIAYTNLETQEENPTEEQPETIPSRNPDHKPRHKGKNGYTYKKLKLDDALAQNNQSEWSPARIRAYQLRHENPNAYYYRFNEPGQLQRNGKWTKEERDQFFKRIEDIGVSGSWGVFSMTIPGRVGYQCANYYRHMVESGEIKDPNYGFDEKGKAHYIGKFKRSAGPIPDSLSTAAKTVTRRKKTKKETFSTTNDSDDEFRPPTSRWRREEPEVTPPNSHENPLPGFVDPITLDEVIQPAMSPWGHVMSYMTWSQCLSADPKNICPFTKKPLKKRELVILTWTNIAQYRERIQNIMAP